MRQAPGKTYGYIILPIGVPAGEKPDVALRNNERYKVIWKVLQALRAHDSRFNAMINQIELNTDPPKQISVIGVDIPGADHDDTTSQDVKTGTDQTAQLVQAMLPLDWEQWKDAIFAKIVDQVGSRRYWEDWAKDVAEIVAAHTERLTALVDSGEWAIKVAFDTFLQALRANLNNSIDQAQAINMLSQHMVTKPVFDALFDDYSFSSHNPVAQVMQQMLDALEGQNLGTETASLDRFYESVRERVQGIDNAQGKQRVLMELYEKFFRLAFAKTAESLGIVYTPVEIVDFIIRSVDHLLHEHFGEGITDEGVHVLDPFTGTGTFIVRLLESGLIKPEDLARKYTHELHANEILLLAYYIAAANIEVTYHTIAHEAEGEYTPFNGIVLTDTFQMTEAGDTLDDKIFADNNDRAVKQLNLPIRVIIGNPPYSAKQSSGNDDNQNLKYPSLDARIEQTYVFHSTATLKNSLYDSYIRAIRWASDRIGDRGIVAFVSNGGYIESNTADGLRLSLAEEYCTLYVYNLRGNQRTAGDLSRREGGKIFGSGSRSTIAVLLAIKDKGHPSAASLNYYDIGDYLSREQKLASVAESMIDTMPWEEITPNSAGDWVKQRNEVFGSYLPMSDSAGNSVFTRSGPAVSTGRDAWVYNFGYHHLCANVESTVQEYFRQRATISGRVAQHARKDTEQSQLLTTDANKISWTSGLRERVVKGKDVSFTPSRIRDAAYRPFTKQRLYLDPDWVERPGQSLLWFPTATMINCGIYVVGLGAQKPFAAHAIDHILDLNYWGSEGGQFFPRWRYEPIYNSSSTQIQLTFDQPDSVIVDGYRRFDNITDTARVAYQKAYGNQVTKDDIFFYVYGLLHSPDYREVFAADLKKMLPRIPKVDTRETFEAFVNAGRDLFDLHVGYEQEERWPDLTIKGDEPKGDPYGWYRVDKMRYGGKGTVKDKTTIIYNDHITITGIPLEAQAYMLGARSALDWIIERYQVKTDKPSGIVNDPNDWSREHNKPRYILDLLCRIVTVSVRTTEIVSSLPRLRFAADGAHAEKGNHD